MNSNRFGLIPGLCVILSLSLVQSPALAQISVLGSLANDQDSEPGQAYSDEITVRNDTDEEVQARVYQTDYLFYHDGTNLFEEPGSTSRSNAGWVQFNPAILTLSPGESEVINYVVTVPEQIGGETPSGSYWSMIMIEGVPKGSPQSTLGDADRPQFGIRQITRYGVQIATHIRKEQRVDVAIAGVELTREALGAPVLELNFENSGNVLIVPETWVELYDTQGELAKRVQGLQSRIYPGTSVAHRFDLSDTPEGVYDALIVVDGGNDNLFGAQYRINL